MNRAPGADPRGPKQKGEWDDDVISQPARLRARKCTSGALEIKLFFRKNRP